jgi:microcystin degradation protein MlrC
MRRRILTGGIWQESHSFIPRATTSGDFVVLTGDKAVAAARGTNTQTGGVIDGAAVSGFDVTIPVTATSGAGGPVDHAFFLEIEETLVAAARKGDFDAIILNLHGAMLTPELEDPEGHLMAALRAVVGNDVPIAATLDLHGHVPPSNVATCDFIAGYLTNPHGDLALTGRRAFRAVADILAGTLKPVVAYLHLPMLTLGNDRTDGGPLKALHAHAAAAVASGAAYDVSIFNIQQFLDVHGAGQAVLAWSNGDAESAGRVAESLGRELWAGRRDLVARYPSLESVVDRLRHGERPLIIGDQGDRVAAGGLGDSTFILHRLRKLGFDGRVAIPIADEQALGQCRAAGKGAEISLTFGGRNTTSASPLTALGTVTAVGRNARGRVHGPWGEGMAIAIDEYALFAFGNAVVLLTSKPLLVLDPAYYEAVGLAPGDFDLVVTRSGYHFTLNFAHLGACVTVETPGPTSYDVAQFPWKRARPFFPLDDLTLGDADFKPQIFRH